MKNLSVKEYCFIVVTLCIVATTLNRWNIGRYDFHIVESKIRMTRRLIDTKTGQVYFFSQWDEKEYSKEF